VQELQREYFVDPAGEVPVPLEMTLYHGFERLPLKVWSRKRPAVEKHFPNILGESIPVPNSKMVELMSSEKEAFEMKLRKVMIDPSHPLGHSVVIGIFSLECEVVESLTGQCS